VCVALFSDRSFFSLREMVRLSVLPALFGGALGASISNCGGPSTNFSNVKLALSPDPIQKGKAFSITASGDMDEDFVGGTATVDLNVDLLDIIKKEIKVTSPFTFTPGVAKGAQNIVIGPITLPSLPGKAEIIGQVSVVNAKGEPIACIKLDISAPLFEQDDDASPATLLDEPAVEGGQLCSKPTDHLKNLKAVTSRGVITLTGTLDEDVTKVSVNVDLKIKAGFFPIPFKSDFPITWSPGVKAGDIKFVAGPPSTSTDLTSDKSPVQVSGQITVMDGNNGELTCISITPNSEDLTSVSNSTTPLETCSKPGDCGKAYQACCIAYEAKGFPCTCHLKDGNGTSTKDCGHCGVAYGACCMGFKAKGYPCTCDISPTSANIVV